jgi:hypothetical protein
MNLLIYLFEKEITVENLTKSFEEGIMATLEIRLQEYDTPVTPSEASEMARVLVSNWKAGTLSKEKLVAILRKEKKIKWGGTNVSGIGD